MTTGNTIAQRVFCIGMNKTGTSTLNHCFEALKLTPIASPKSYDREVRRLINHFYKHKSYDAMLYELVADPTANKPDKRAERGGFNPLGALQTGMKDVLDLKFQLDEVDYRPANFVHADMSPEEFLASMAKKRREFLQNVSQSHGTKHGDAIGESSKWRRFVTCGVFQEPNVEVS